MDCFCHKAAIRSHHKTTKLCVNCNISHSCRNKYFFINLADTLSDHTDIIRFLIRCVRNSNTTRQINKLNMYSCFFLKTLLPVQKELLRASDNNHLSLYCWQGMHEYQILLHLLPSVILNASVICSVVIPYFASPGLSIISLLILNIPPGL